MNYLKLRCGGLEDIAMPDDWRWLRGEDRDIEVLRELGWTLVANSKENFRHLPMEEFVTVRSMIPPGRVVYPHHVVGLIVMCGESAARAAISDGRLYSKLVRENLGKRLRPVNGKRLDVRRENWRFSGKFEIASEVWVPRGIDLALMGDRETGQQEEFDPASTSSNPFDVIAEPQVSLDDLFGSKPLLKTGSETANETTPEGSSTELSQQKNEGESREKESPQIPDFT